MNMVMQKNSCNFTPYLCHSIDKYLKLNAIDNMNRILSAMRVDIVYPARPKTERDPVHVILIKKYGRQKVHSENR